ncbi:MAG: hypothetical protein HOO93_01855 [Methyloglobulus sp.]|nr:hypothetical protein [Methyloglobulus sp.]
MLSEPHESDIIFAEIGRITVRWAEVEDVLAILVSSLLNDFQRYTRIVATELSYRNLTNLILSLYRERHGEDDDFSHLKELIGKADKVEQDRNKITHSTWYSAGTPHLVTRIKKTAKRKYSSNIENYDPESFRKISDEIVEIKQELVALIQSLIEKGKAFENPVFEN